MQAQGAGDHPRAPAVREAVEGGGPRALPEPDLLRPRALRLRGGGALLLRQVGEEIDLAEAALLAGLPQSPERLSPRKHPDAAKTRQRYVLGQMADHGYIERKTAERIAAEPIRLAREPAAARGAGGRGGRRRAARFLRRQAGRGGGVRGGDDGRRRRWTRACRSWRAPRSSAAWKSWTRARATAAVGARDRQGAATASAASWAKHVSPKFLKGSDIVEGIVLRFEKDATSPSRSGKLFVDVGAGVPGERARRRGQRSRRGKGRLAQKVKAPPPPALPAADAGGLRRLQPRAPLREGDEAARRPLQARRSRARAPGRRSPAQGGRAAAAGARAGPAGGDGGHGSDHARGAGAGRRLRLPRGRLRPLAAGAPPAGVGVQAGHLRRRARGPPASRPRRS